LLLCISTDERLWRSPRGDQPNERRRKAGQNERSNREGHAVSAGPVKTFRSASDVKNDTAGLRTKSNLRVKRRDPWRGANALPKAAADLVLSVKTRKISRRRVLTWFASRWRNHQFKQAEKPHSKFSSRKTLDGPATRPKTPLAVENSVGKPAADQAPNVGMGKRAWRTPIPDHLKNYA
jgi:hypothetical protein